MASSFVSNPSTILKFSQRKSLYKLPHNHFQSPLTLNKKVNIFPHPSPQTLQSSKPNLGFSLTPSLKASSNGFLEPTTTDQENDHFHSHLTPNKKFNFFPHPSPQTLQFSKPNLGFSLTPSLKASSNGFLEPTTTDQENESLVVPLLKDRPVKFLFWVFVCASVSVVWFAFSGDAEAAVDSIKASSFGIKFANKLRGLGWRDEVVVFSLATLPIIELRGAIPVGYWLQLKPFLLTTLAVLGNMVPVPFIIIYLKPLAKFLAGKNKSASHFLDVIFKKAKAKAGPVEEFQWLGLMLFVAVPFPGTGAWTGAIIASILDMPFWSAFTANFFGVVFAGLLVNLLVNLGLKYALFTGVVLFLVSTFMWSILRTLRRFLGSSN